MRTLPQSVLWEREGAQLSELSELNVEGTRSPPCPPLFEVVLLGHVISSSRYFAFPVEGPGWGGGFS